MLYETKSISSYEHEAICFDDIIEPNNHFRLLDYVIDHCDENLEIPMLYKLYKTLKMGSTDSTLE